MNMGWDNNVQRIWEMDTKKCLMNMGDRHLVMFSEYGRQTLDV